MATPLLHRLSRRQRQIMEAIYMLGSATAVQVLEAMTDPPGLSAVRKMITLLEAKGFLRHEQEGQHFVYLPTLAREEAARSAMHQVLSTFFNGDLKSAMTGLLAAVETRLSEDDAAELVRLIEEAETITHNHGDRPKNDGPLA